MKSCPQSIYPKNEFAEYICLLAFGGLFSGLLIMFLIKKYKEHIRGKTTPAPIEFIFVKESEEAAPAEFKKHRKIASQKIDLHENEPHSSDFFTYTAEQKKSVSDITTTKSVKRRNSKETTDISSALFSAVSALPTEIRFSDEFIYPSAPQSHYQLYPLPGHQRSKPVAKVTINSHSTLIYNTQFGVLTTDDFSDESRVAVHQRCLENGQVVFSKICGLFKTHPIKTAGDERVYATHQIVNKEGLTLHLFDTSEQHTHYRK